MVKKIYRQEPLNEFWKNERWRFEKWIKTKIHVTPEMLKTYNWEQRYCDERVNMAWEGWKGHIKDSQFGYGND